MQLARREDAHWFTSGITLRFCALASPTNEPPRSFGERAIHFLLPRSLSVDPKAGNELLSEQKFISCFH